MRNMIENLIKNNTYIDDKVIMLSMLSSAKASANMYLNSALTSSTPELRAINGRRSHSTYRIKY